MLGIDTGTFLELTADGTWSQGGRGFMVSFWRESGRWHVADCQLALELAYIGCRDEPTPRFPPGETARDYPKCFAITRDGAAMQLDEVGVRFPPWRRVDRPPSR